MPGDDRRPVILLAFANEQDDRARCLRCAAREYGPMPGEGHGNRVERAGEQWSVRAKPTLYGSRASRADGKADDGRVQSAKATPEARLRQKAAEIKAKPKRQ